MLAADKGVKQLFQEFQHVAFSDERAPEPLFQDVSARTPAGWTGIVVATLAKPPFCN